VCTFNILQLQLQQQAAAYIYQKDRKILNSQKKKFLLEKGQMAMTNI